MQEEMTLQPFKKEGNLDIVQDSDEEDNFVDVARAPAFLARKAIVGNRKNTQLRCSWIWIKTVENTKIKMIMNCRKLLETMFII